MYQLFNKLFTEFVRLDIKRTSATHRHCVYPQCENKEHLGRVPEGIRLSLLRKFNIFVPNDARVCTEHKSEEIWSNADFDDQLYSFNSKQVQDMVDLCLNKKGILEKPGNLLTCNAYDNLVAHKLI